MEEKRWEKEEGGWQKTEEIEAEKVTLLRELVQSSGSDKYGREEKGFFVEEAVESLRDRVGVLET